MREPVLALLIALLPAPVFAQVEHDRTRVEFVARPQFAHPNSGGLGGGGLGGGGGGLGGGGNAFSQPQTDRDQGWFERLLQGSIQLNSVDFSVPLGVDGYECDLAHELAFDQARRRGLNLHPKSPLPASIVDRQQVGRICQFFHSWDFVPRDRTDDFRGIRLNIFVIGGWWGQLESRTPFPGGEIVRVWIRPQLAVGSVLLADIKYTETYIISRHGTIISASGSGPEEWRGRNPIAAIVQATIPIRVRGLALAHP